MFLYHYFDSTTGPFVSLSELSAEEAETVLHSVKATKPGSLCAKRDDAYMENRHRCEKMMRAEFVKKGGVMSRTTPHYMIVGPCHWLSTWYENSSFLKIPIDEFDVRTISFTYGDSMPTFSPKVNDGREYRKWLYTLEEIRQVIDRYGLPQDWNRDGNYGPERYIEAQIWSDETINRYRRKSL